MPKTLRNVLFVIGSVVVLAVSFLTLPACSDDGSTTGKRITLKTRMQLADDESTSFTTGLGWNVTLHKVVLGTAGLYYFDGVPPLASRSNRPSFRRVVQNFFSIPVAHAHPGHYEPGNALGQMKDAYTEDLLGGPVDLPDGAGVTGVYRSARFSFAKEVEGPDADALDGHVAVIVGRAEKDGEASREFYATADYDEVAKSQSDAEVNGCVFEETDVEDDGTVTVTIKPHIWFQLVDFGELAPGTKDKPTEFAPDTRPSVAFAQGLAQLSAYRFTYSR